MRWVMLTLAGPTLWAVLFSAVYALHGTGCARGWNSIDTGPGTLHMTAMTGLWLFGLLLHLGLLMTLPGGSLRQQRLPRLGAWIGLIASLMTLAPILLTSTCG